MLKRLAAVAALTAVPFAAVSPAFAAPTLPVTIAQSDESEASEEEEEGTEEAEASAPSYDVGTFGYAFGVDPTTWQFSNAFLIRHSPWGDWSEATLGLNARSQVIDPTRAYAFEMTGVNAQFGVKAWFLRLGVLGEIDWVRRITQSGGQLSWQNSPGFSVEPYVGTTLPFFRTPFTSLDARVYVPVGRFVPSVGFLSPDPAVGPRLMFTLWVGMPDDEEEEGLEEDEESMEPEALEEEPEFTPPPAPKPTPKPAPKK